MEDLIYEDFDVLKISRRDGSYVLEDATKPVIAEISLKIYINGDEMASLICLNQQQEELAIGFLFNEGVIGSLDDIEETHYNDRAVAVMLTLKEGVSVKRQESLRSVTAGCGKCTTYINPLMRNQFKKVHNSTVFSLEDIMGRMHDFSGKSEVFRVVGGVHSLLFYTPEYSVFSEDLGRHNCLDKITGTLLKERKLPLAEHGIIFISGRITSEIITKVIRLGVPVIVSKSTPSVAAVKLAKEYNITLVGYARNETGYVYSGAERLLEAARPPVPQINQVEA